MNTYTGLSQDDMKLTVKIISLKNKVKDKNVSLVDFKSNLIDLYEIRAGGLCEGDEEIICDVFDNLCNTHPSHLASLSTDTHVFIDGSTMVDFIRFLMTIDL